MAIEKDSLFTEGSLNPQAPRMYPRNNGTKVVKFAASAGAELLPAPMPAVYDSSSNTWKHYTQPSDAAIYTITANGTPASAGTFSLLIDGLVAEFAFDVAAAAIQSALNALLLDAGKPYTVAAVATTGTDLGDASAVVTITFSENAGAPSVQLDASDLTGNPHVLAASDAGTQLNGTNQIRGFVYGDSVQLHATNEVLGVLMIDGDVHRDDVNTAAMRALMAGSPSEAEVDAALRDPELRKLNLRVLGLTQVR